MSRKNVPSTHTIIYLAVLLVACGVLFLLKGLTGSTSQTEDANVARPTNIPGGKGHMAVPDTTVAADVDASVRDTLHQTDPSLTPDRDQRTAEEAGAEDGYWDGYYDGSQGREQNAERLSAPPYTTAVARDTYATNYREGYRRGYDEGCRNRKTIAADGQ
ncbi:MAG: hypothetical protein ACI4V2_01560 [Alloprevotella sp.]